MTIGGLSKRGSLGLGIGLALLPIGGLSKSLFEARGELLYKESGIEIREIEDRRGSQVWIGDREFLLCSRDLNVLGNSKHSYGRRESRLKTKYPELFQAVIQSVDVRAFLEISERALREREKHLTNLAYGDATYR